MKKKVSETTGDSSIIEQIMKDTSLEIRIGVLLEMEWLTMNIVPDRTATDEELQQAHAWRQKMVKLIMENFHKWEADGRPDYCICGCDKLTCEKESCVTTQQYKAITGWNTPKESNAYTKGALNEAETIFMFIEKWNGKTNSALGELLAKKVKEQNK